MSGSPGERARQAVIRGVYDMSEDVALAPPQQQTVTKPEQDRRPKRQPRYNVVLWDDDDHTYEYVIKMLVELFAHSVETSFKMAVEVDTQGRVIVLTTTLEHAELKRDQIHAYGKDALSAGSKGSMKASIEPAPED